MSDNLSAELAGLRKQLEALEYKIGEKYHGPEIPHGWQSPVQTPRQIVKDSGDPGYINRVLLGTATTGLVRVEWVAARYGAITPANWAHVGMVQPMADTLYPLRYQVDDAQNIIVKTAVERDFEWLILIEHDNVIPENTFMLFNEYMRKKDTPVVSGLYYTRNRPSEPLVYRGRGTSYYGDWKFGDLVWCDGVPTGTLLIHMSILRAMWNEAPEYMIGSEKCRRVFETPRHVWFDPESNQFNSTSGTSDLDWCTKVMKGDYFRKAGWEPYADMEFPFLVDTRIFVKHINPTGEVFP
jgi:hypothetical protein